MKPKMKKAVILGLLMTLSSTVLCACNMSEDVKDSKETEITSKKNIVSDDNDGNIDDYAVYDDVNSDDMDEYVDEMETAMVGYDNPDMRKQLEESPKLKIGGVEIELENHTVQDYIDNGLLENATQIIVYTEDGDGSDTITYDQLKSGLNARALEVWFRDGFGDSETAHVSLSFHGMKDSNILERKISEIYADDATISINDIDVAASPEDVMNVLGLTYRISEPNDGDSLYYSFGNGSTFSLEWTWGNLKSCTFNIGKDVES